MNSLFSSLISLKSDGTNANNQTGVNEEAIDLEGIVLQEQGKFFAGHTNEALQAQIHLAT